jgi:hypothetical protein
MGVAGMALFYLSSFIRSQTKRGTTVLSVTIIPLDYDDFVKIK